jgi:hypothetical protein
MTIRKGPSGTELMSRQVTVTVPAILDGDSADVVAFTDARFAGGPPRRPLTVAFVGAPLANLQTPFAWVSNATTGAVSVRFPALLGNVAGGDVDLYIEEQAGGA